MRKGYGTVGIDEAGRGPLAGPVVAAAVILPRGFDTEGIDDSKVLSPTIRAELAARIKAKAKWSVAVVDIDVIDRINILWASMRAMELALAGLGGGQAKVFVDGNRLPLEFDPSWATAVVDGDAKVACIAAASIIAKTTRDRLMTELAESYPAYGFDKHFGYATPRHLHALREWGPCPIHRRSFSPVREMLLQPCLIFDS